MEEPYIGLLVYIGVVGIVAGIAISDIPKIKFDKVYLLKKAAILLGSLYICCMIIDPWFQQGKNIWSHVQDVWDRWQGFNVGMLAFLSSVIALSISRVNANKQRERDFTASKAFLPEALSELCDYFAASARVFELGWKSESKKKPDFIIPELPRDYKSVFANCIRHAEPSVGDYLSRILVWLQVHDARLRSYVKQHDDETYLSPDRQNLISYLYRLGELRAMVNKLFEFARNMKEFDSTPLEWEDFRNAYGNLDIWIEEIVIDDEMNLEAFTKRAIARNDGKSK